MFRALRATPRLLDQLPHPAYAHPGDPVFRAGKQSTGIAGLLLLKQPLPILIKLCHNTLLNLEAVPPTAVYRTATEALVKHRLQVIQAAAGPDGHEGGEEAVERVEKELELGQIEEVIQIAEDEERLVTKMLEWRPWEDLVEKPTHGQWEYFKMAPSTTNPEATDPSS